jgi:hypothetical protein
MTVGLDVSRAVDPILVLSTDRLPASRGVRRLSIFDIISIESYSLNPDYS